MAPREQARTKVFMAKSRIGGVARWRHAIILSVLMYKFNILSNNNDFDLNPGF
jgi:hypothetical protein